MNTKYIILLITFFLYVHLAEAQTSIDFASGEVMVQLKSKTNLSSILSINNLSIKRIISDRFNIYLLQFDTQETNNKAVIDILKSNKAVIHVQNNHKVHLRESLDITQLIPDDFGFNNQWALLNTGQGGGTIGADIDATLAWDITTGGVTAHGDTIVVAIVDGGADLSQNDLDFWKNRDEIPNNNIDDDNNGYVDDYDGWNAYTHNGNIPIHIHGTHVAGIAGAIGNNEIGIAGVNWNVKTLPVAGDSQFESYVVEALSYIYVVRETYNQTNGAKGAFVVADNCSFGIDEAQPQNYPIWEAMYDSLGKIGVLSMCATANRNWDIDVVGDVPTAFTTDYMIAVTNTTKRDEKKLNAGYGLTSIDLGAPGTLIQSLTTNNGLSTKSGTSMATPHVTGAMALLMAAADSAFISQYKNHPEQTTLLIKNYLLSGVDQIADLQNITVTGGRLNVFNSINLMLNGNDIATNRDSIYNELLINTSKLDSITITNLSIDTIQFSLSIQNQPSWITLPQNTGTIMPNGTSTPLIQFNSNNLDTGFYNCVISIEVAGGETKLIPVTLYVFESVGVDNITNKASVKVFPNPASTFVEFSFTANKIGNSTIQIFNQLGSIVYNRSMNNVIGNNKFIWHSNALSSGIYFYKLMIDNKLVAADKIVKL